MGTARWVAEEAAVLQHSRAVHHSPEDTTVQVEQEQQVVQEFEVQVG